MAIDKESYVKRYIMACKQEADSAKQNRMNLNRDNFAMYQMEYDFSHKRKGQSTEVLAKTRNATEQIKSFFQQALADLSDWYRITARDGSDGSAMIVKPEEMYKLMNYMLQQADYFSHVGLSVQSGLLGSLSITKVTGCFIPKPKFTTRKEGRGKSYKKHVVMIDEKTWELRFDIIRQENYYPDPTCSNLYEIEESEIDLHIVKQYAEGDDAIYDKSEVDDLSPYAGTNDGLQNEKTARETGQNTPTAGMRPRVKTTEFYGDVIDDGSGGGKPGDIMFERVLITLANEEIVIRKPTPNPMWHQRSCIVAAALIEVANSVWGIALMDAGTKHNRSLIEIFNLMLDSAMKAVWGVNQIRTDALEDQSQIINGVPWGTNLKVNSSLVPGAKVMEEVITGMIPNEVMTMFNLLNQETLTSMMTNDMRMGAQSMRAVKATEVVAAENSITSVFQGMAKNFEEKKIQPELELACYTICQNWDLIDKEVFKSLFGVERGEQLAALEPQDVFVSTVNGMKFEVFGISITLRRQADFRKWTTLLQTVSASPVLTEAFLQKYSFENFLGEVMTALDIDKSKISNQDPAASPVAEVKQAADGPIPMNGPDAMSQVPSAANIPQESSLASILGGAQMNMPSAQAMS